MPHAESGIVLLTCTCQQERELGKLHRVGGEENPSSVTLRSARSQEEQSWNLKVLKKERVNNQNCSRFYAPAIKCYTISIIHMWVHVIYLQLELLSIQQLKTKNCWYSADEEASPVSGLWPFFSKMMNTQYRSLVLENHFGLMHRKLHCQHFHWQHQMTLAGSTETGRPWLHLTGAVLNPHRKQHRASQSRIYSRVTSYYNYLRAILVSGPQR